ncbi:MAG: hypothetical protein RLZZ189_2383, partial [Pseudomonadota bacterium]
MKRICIFLMALCMGLLNAREAAP